MELNRETKFWIENIRRGFQCGQFEPSKCVNCKGFDHCMDGRRALKFMIRAIKGRNIPYAVYPWEEESKASA